MCAAHVLRSDTGPHPIQGVDPRHPRPIDHRRGDQRRQSSRVRYCPGACALSRPSGQNFSRAAVGRCPPGRKATADDGQDHRCVIIPFFAEHICQWHCSKVSDGAPRPSDFHTRSIAFSACLGLRKTVALATRSQRHWPTRPALNWKSRRSLQITSRPGIYTSGLRRNF
jgi:hypothetical protein